MKPKPDSLKEEIEKIITNIFDRVDNSTWKEARDQATTAILELIEKRLPEGYDMDYVIKRNIGGTSIHIAEGYNQCLEDIRKELK